MCVTRPRSVCNSDCARTSSSTTASRRWCGGAGCGVGVARPGDGPMVGGRGTAALPPKKAGDSVGSVVGAGGKLALDAGGPGVRLKVGGDDEGAGGLLLLRVRRARKSATTRPSASAGKCATRPVRNSAERSFCSRPFPYTITCVSKYCSRPWVKLTPEYPSPNTEGTTTKGKLVERIRLTASFWSKATAHGSPWSASSACSRGATSPTRSTGESWAPTMARAG